MNWADAIPLTSVVVVAFASGGALVTLRAIAKSLAELTRRTELSAKEQGQRIGDLESWQVAHTTEHRVTREHEAP